MDPVQSATLFFERLVTVAGWLNMRPTIAAWHVQVNADPEHYDRFVDGATQTVDGITDACTQTAQATGEWIAPARGVTTDVYGTCGGDRGNCHGGTDIADGSCDGPIWAAVPGTVSHIGWSD